MAKVEVTGVLLDERRPPNCGDFFTGRIRMIDGDSPIGEARIVGNCEAGELKLQLAYRFYGDWKEDEKWGRQLRVETFVPAKPHGRGGVVKYLQEAPHIGEATAVQLWNLFNSDAVRICREHPEIVTSKIPRLSLDKCQEISDKLKELSALEDTSIELIDLLSGRGFPKATARAAIKKWGNKAHWVISHDPFRLMAFRSCGFLRCDSMWMDLGLPPGRMKRQLCCAWYSIASDTEGHTWLPEITARQFLQAKIAGVELNFDKAIGVAVRAKALSVKRWCSTCRGSGRAKVPDLFFGETLEERTCPSCGGIGGSLWLADARKARAEDYIAQKIAEAELEESQWPEILAAAEGERGPTEHQAGEVAKALRGAIGLLLGSPGTGKTFTAAYIVQRLIEKFGRQNVAICAPTGKAAVRCTESMAAYGIDIRACTIHSLLGVESADDGGGWSFKHNEYQPLPHKFIIVDEASMPDVPLVASLLAARARGTHILFVGDPNQLPPVGHGAPLRDFIAAGLPHGKLTEIKRNAGTIVRACASIRDGKPVEIDSQLELEPQCDCCDGQREYGVVCEKCDGTGKLSPRNLVLLTANKTAAPTVIEQQVLALKEKGIDPIWQVQVIVAVNKRSPLARAALNKRLQELLNPAGASAGGSPFRVNDKVICLKNGFYKSAAEHSWESDGAQQVPVANGEFGRVYRVEEKKTWIEFSNPTRKVVVGRAPLNPKAKGGEDEKEDAAGTGCDIDLGYAVTCHKMQGSDCDYVIVGLDEYPGATGKFGICKREWSLTSISRARTACFLVGLRQTLRIQCSETALDKRKTFLRELIEKYREEFKSKGIEACQASESESLLPVEA
jgi:hypothetical protein